LIDAIRVGVSLHELVRCGEVGAGQILLPRLRVPLRQLLLDVRERRQRPDALAHEQIHGIGTQTAIGSVLAGVDANLVSQSFIISSRLGGIFWPRSRASIRKCAPYTVANSAVPRPTTTDRVRPESLSRLRNVVQCRIERSCRSARVCARLPNSGREITTSALNPLLTSCSVQEYS
jgi:hypothetical protein